MNLLCNNRLQQTKDDRFQQMNADGDKRSFTCAVPLDAIKIRKPDDGLPCLEDFITCVISLLFSGSRLAREPLDLNLAMEPSSLRAHETFYLTVKKGFTRLNLKLYWSGIFYHFIMFLIGHFIVIWLQMADPGQVVSSFYYWRPTLTQSVERRIEFAKV